MYADHYTFVAGHEPVLICTVEDCGWYVSLESKTLKIAVNDAALHWLNCHAKVKEK